MVVGGDGKWDVPRVGVQETKRGGSYGRGRGRRSRGQGCLGKVVRVGVVWVAFYEDLHCCPVMIDHLCGHVGYWASDKLGLCPVIHLHGYWRVVVRHRGYR